MAMLPRRQTPRNQSGSERHRQPHVQSRDRTRHRRAWWFPPCAHRLSTSATTRVRPIERHSFPRSHLDACIVDLSSLNFVSVVLLKLLLRRFELVQDVLGGLELVCQRTGTLLQVLQMALHLLVHWIPVAFTARPLAPLRELLVQGPQRPVVRVQTLPRLGQGELCLGNCLVGLEQLSLQLPLQRVDLVHPPGELSLRLGTRLRAIPPRADHQGIAIIGYPHCVLFGPQGTAY
mmetsp:Transcript_7330/g.18351  ORF Transcript_7330/g.18351 Transcript_7330/m.18351 type:complete len:233 (+) Transcript_7330:250-948(+)